MVSSQHLVLFTLTFIVYVLTRLVALKTVLNPEEDSREFTLTIFWKEIILHAAHPNPNYPI